MKPTETLPISSAMKAVGRPIAYYPQIAKVVGGVKAAIFLCQFLYWEGKQDDEDFIYKTMDEIFNETGLSRKEQESSRRHLKKLGILEEKVKGVPPVVHYKFNWSKLDEILTSQFVQKEQINLPQTDKLKCPKGANPIYNIYNINNSNTENTTENTMLSSKKTELNPSVSSKVKPKTDPRIIEIISHFQEAHLRETNLKPLIDGKVGSLAKKLLSTYNLESIKQYINRFFEIKDDSFIQKGGRSFGIFYHVVQKIALDLNRKDDWDSWVNSRKGNDDARAGI